MPSYQAPLDDFRFVLNDLLGLKDRAGEPGYEDVSEDLIDAILEIIALGHAQGRFHLDAMTWTESFHTGKWIPGTNGEDGKYESGYCLIGLPTLDYVDQLQQAVLEVKIPYGEDNDFKTYCGYLEKEAPENGWRPVVVRLPTKIYQNKTLFPEGVRDLLRKSLAKFPEVQDSDWKIVEFKEDLSPPLVKLSVNTNFQTFLQNHPGHWRQAGLQMVGPAPSSSANCGQSWPRCWRRRSRTRTGSRSRPRPATWPRRPAWCGPRLPGWRPSAAAEQRPRPTGK